MKPHPISYNGGPLSRDEFGLRTKRGGGLNPEGVDAIVFYCPSGANRICEIPVTLGPPLDADAQGVHRWHWDGNMQAPTLTPSIGCDARCGWHGNIVAGRATNGAAGTGGANG